jgi:hypothetical protein
MVVEDMINYVEDKVNIMEDNHPLSVQLLLLYLLPLLPLL